VVEEHLVALTPYDGSRENTETLADQIHRIAQFYGVEAVLTVILSDSPGVTIAAVSLYNAWRRAHGLPPVEHVLCMIHRLNLVYQAFDKALLAECEAWRKGHELVKAVRSGHVRHALEELGSDVTVIDAPNEIRWHHRIGCMEKLGQASPYLVRLAEDPPATLAVASDEFHAKLVRIGIADVDELRSLHRSQTDRRLLRGDVSGADQEARVQEYAELCAARLYHVDRCLQGARARAFDDGRGRRAGRAGGDAQASSRGSRG
jgi:hypothetical protein